MPIDLKLNKIIPTILSRMSSGIDEVREQLSGGSPLSKIGTTEYRPPQGVKQAVNRFRIGFNAPQDPVSKLVRGELSFQKKTREISKRSLPKTSEEALSRGMIPIRNSSGEIIATIDPIFAGSMKNVETVGRQAVKHLVQKTGFLGKVFKGKTPPLPGATNTVNETTSKIIHELNAAQPIRKAQEKLYSQERARRVAQIVTTGKNVGGEKGFHTQLGQLKGELPKAKFESVRGKFQQQEIDSMFDAIEKTESLLPLEKITTKNGLSKLLGGEGGSVPTNNEIALLREVFGKEFSNAVMEKRPFGDKVLHTIGDVINIPRAIRSSADFSAPFRQGIFLIGKPKQFVPAVVNMFKYAFSEKAYKGLNETIRKRPTYQSMRVGKLALTELDTPLNLREEAFMGQIVEKIPGIGSVVRVSNRAYTGFLNKLRADTFDDLLSKADKLGIEKTDDMIRDTAKFINSATGRGDIGAAMNKAAPVLNAVFFSPRLMASRLNLLNPLYYLNLHPFVRKEALKSLLTFSATAGTVLGLANLHPDAEVGIDPRSADFGKIKIGNTRYDILGGFQQYIKLGAQLTTGTVISSTSGKEITLGEGYKPLTRKDVILRFFENKTSPVASFVIGLLQGKNAVGEEFNIPEEVINLFIPMVSQDLYDLYQEDGLKGVVEGLPAMFGVGVQTYGKQELVLGKNKVGQESAQIRPVQGLGERISEEILGAKPLGTSNGFNIEVYEEELNKLPPEEAADIYDKIYEMNPELAKKISEVVKDKEKGLTVHDKTLKSKGVASGDRAIAIKKELDKLKTDEERGRLWDDYSSKGIITDAVSEQLLSLISQ